MNKNYLIILICILPFLVSCDKMPAYKIISSGVDVYSAHTNIVWLDNHRVMFNMTKYAIRKKNHNMKPGVYIWDIEKGISYYAMSDDKKSPLCFDNGNIAYTVKFNDHKEIKERTSIIKIGEFGKEKEMLLKHGPGQLKVNRFDCKLYRVENTDRKIRALRHEHGMLDLGEKKNRDITTKISLIKPDGARIPLNIPNGDVQVIRYLQYQNMYYIYRYRNSQEGLVGYYLSPEGHVTKNQIPEGPWTSAHGSVIESPSRQGVLIVKHSDKYKYGGMYLVSQNITTKIVSNYVRQLRISPNGCKAAFLHRENSNKPRYHYVLKTINLCNENN